MFCDPGTISPINTNSWNKSCFSSRLFQRMREYLYDKFPRPEDAYLCISLGVSANIPHLDDISGNSHTKKCTGDCTFPKNFDAICSYEFHYRKSE